MQYVDFWQDFQHNFLGICTFLCGILWPLGRSCSLEVSLPMDWSVFSSPEYPEKELQDLIALPRKRKEGHHKATNISAAGAKSAMPWICAPLCDVGPYRAWENPKCWTPSLCVEWTAIEKCQVPPLRMSFVLISARIPCELFRLHTEIIPPLLLASSLLCSVLGVSLKVSFPFRSKLKWRLNTGNLTFPVQGV